MSAKRRRRYVVVDNGYVVADSKTIGDKFLDGLKDIPGAAKTDTELDRARMAQLHPLKQMEVLYILGEGKASSVAEAERILERDRSL